MNIKLTSTIPVLGKKGQTISVGKALAAGLIRKGQAEYVKSKEPTVKELQEIAREKGIPYAGKNKKELKEAIETKEEKSEYQTK